MCVCMYLCMYVYMYVCMHPCITYMGTMQCSKNKLHFVLSPVFKKDISTQSAPGAQTNTTTAAPPLLQGSLSGSAQYLCNGSYIITIVTIHFYLGHNAK